MVRLRMLSKWSSFICKCLLAAGCLALFLPTPPAQAQAQLHFADVKISLLPEYDQPSVLVIYQLSLAPDTTLPVQLKLTLPARAQVWAVAETDASGTLIDVANTSQTQAGRTVLAFTSDSLSVHVEYYEPFVKNGQARHIAFEWPGDYAASALAVDFQLPVGATNLVLSPSSVTTTTEQGFNPLPDQPGQPGCRAEFHLDGRLSEAVGCFKRPNSPGNGRSAPSPKHAHEILERQPDQPLAGVVGRAAADRRPIMAGFLAEKPGQSYLPEASCPGGPGRANLAGSRVLQPVRYTCRPGGRLLPPVWRPPTEIRMSVCPVPDGMLLGG